MKVLALLLVSLGIAFAQTDTAQIKPSKKFWSLAGGLVISTVYDIETTEHCIDLRRCHEGFIAMRSFYGNGRGVAYGVNMGVDVGVIALSHALKRHSAKRWALPMWSGIAVHGADGTANLRFR